MELSQGHYLKQWCGSTLIIELIGELTVSGINQYLEEITDELSSFTSLLVLFWIYLVLKV